MGPFAMGPFAMGPYAMGPLVMGAYVGVPYLTVIVWNTFITYERCDDQHEVDKF
jgi:hypothetical protein